MKRIFLVLIVCLTSSAFARASTPGKHQVILTWNASTTTGVTYNVYRGATAGVCNGTPTPYATGITATTFTDSTGLSDGQTLFYNVSAVKNGGESTCDGEIQVQIPLLPTPPASLQGSAQ